MISALSNQGYGTVRTYRDLIAPVAVQLIFGSHFIATPLFILGYSFTTFSFLMDRPLLYRIACVLNRVAMASIIGSALFHPLIHESGHACMAQLLYKMPELSIGIDGQGGGSTTYFTSGGLTSLGAIFGEDYAQIAVAMGGCIASLTWGFFAPAPALIYSGMARLLTEAYYALTALQAVQWDHGHDYQFLREYAHVTPLIPAAILLGAFLYRMREAVSSVY